MSNHSPVLNKLEELFDRLVRTVRAYPVTLFRLFFARRRLVEEPASEFVCSPSIVVLFSGVIGYFARMSIASSLIPVKTCLVISPRSG
jgi:hypothetical protein